MFSSLLSSLTKIAHILLILSPKENEKSNRLFINENASNKHDIELPKTINKYGGHLKKSLSFRVQSYTTKHVIKGS
jgi:hypothetical protein